MSWPCEAPEIFFSSGYNFFHTIRVSCYSDYENSRIVENCTVQYKESQKCNEYKSRREQITVTGNTIVVLQMRK